jgi:LuxR family transcriptional regulator, maltose regulon positive regulatory protein
MAGTPPDPAAVHELEVRMPQRADERLVARPRLVDCLLASTQPLLVVHAPAGYGKTALLEQWDAADEREFAWVRLGDAGVEPPVVLDALAGQLDGPGRRRVLVLDDAQALSPDTLALAADVALRQPSGCVVVVAGRGEPGLPLGRLRVEGSVLELGATELALTEDEAAALLAEAGLALEPDELATLYHRGEGWPAGLRLAALAVADQTDTAAAVARFGGDDRVVMDYVRDALLGPLTPSERAFLRSSAPLGELSGPLCDAVLEREGSGALLRRLARSDVLVIPVDRAERRFHMHPLLADALTAELARCEPERESWLHLRASAWHAEHGSVPRALDHAICARDPARAGELLWGVAGAYATSGRGRQLGGWLGPLAEAGVDDQPALALSAAVERLAAGDRDAAERWANAAERALAQNPDARDRSLAAGLATVRAGLARGGAAQLLADAERARALADDGVWRSSACLLEGAAHRLLGAPERARVRLARAARRGRVPTPSVRVQALALLVLLELERDDLESALALGESALHELEVEQLLEDPGCALLHAAAAWAQARAGQVEEARAHAVRSRRLLAQLRDPAPWYVAETSVALACALLRLSDAHEARELLTTAGRMRRALPDASGLQTALDAAWERADSFAIGAVAGPSALTIAELRVLRFLPSHLSFREIAERLHVSANTVKTQAHAVYRKLDASSRSEAVARASLIGLIDA